MTDQVANQRCLLGAFGEVTETISTDDRYGSATSVDQGTVRVADSLALNSSAFVVDKIGVLDSVITMSNKVSMIKMQIELVLCDLNDKVPLDIGILNHGTADVLNDKSHLVSLAGPAPHSHWMGVVSLDKWSIGVSVEHKVPVIL
ncbi:hypothetical protein ACHAWO_008313 [Cyclotella atomus]|uniref:Cadherin domain-containing protein n=1 Tax=Cyclotella atomus TaxID=382360 RepID=A0ABD3NFB4_9STRA